MTLSYFLSFVLLYKYTALFLITFLASLILPLPAGATLIASGAFAFQGYFNLWMVLATAYLGSVLGDWLGYFLSRLYGKEVLKKIGFRRMLHSPWFLEMEKDFPRHASAAVFFTRFVITWLGSVVNIVSGLTKFSLRKFLFFDIIGEALYVSIFSLIGYVFTDAWQNVSGIIQNLTGFLAILVLIAVILHWNHRRRRKLVR